jgi:quinol monooxygenase YgiN
MLLVDAQCFIKSDRQDDFMKEVRKIIPLVRREAGCYRYDLFSDVIVPGNFHFIEVWESQDHLDDHLVQPHMREYFAKSAQWQSSPAQLTRCEILSPQSITLDD